METGKTSKYLKYAIGEIILVVIGILIALSINNWNGIRKDNMFEIKMIKEIVTALEGDSRMMTLALVSRLEIKKRGINALINLADSRTKVHDTIIMRHYSDMRIGTHMSFNFGPYEALKANGLEKIRNDSIRLLITGIYEFAYPRQSTFYHKVEQLNENAISITEKELFENIIASSAEKEKEIKRIPKDDSFLQDSRLWDIIRMEQEDLGEKLFRLEDVLAFNKSLRDKLNKYIDTTEN